MSRQIVLDTETTGLSVVDGDRVIELGCVELLNRKLTGNNLHLYFNPERDSHEEALRVHGLTTEFLRDKPKFAEKAQDILAYLQDAELIIHNAPFDVGFLNKELDRLGLKPLKSYVSAVTDTLAMAKELFPGKRNSLDALCDRFGISNAHRTLHGALLDSQLLAEVWLAMTRGQDALLIDVDDSAGASGGGMVLARFDASGLPVITASAEELAEHEAYLAALDKSVGGECVWRKVDAPVAAAA